MIGSNPFCTRFVRPGAIAYHFASDAGSLDSLCQSLQIARRGLIVGPHGSGKSTLLQSMLPLLRQRFARVEQVQLLADPKASLRNGLHQKQQNWNVIRDQLTSLCGHDLLIIDGLEQTFTQHRIGMLKRSKHRSPLILGTSHRPLLGLPVLFETSIDRQQIIRLTNQLIGNCPDPVAGLVHQKLAHHDWERPTNLRDFWFDCYDDIQHYQQQLFQSQESST